MKNCMGTADAAKNGTGHRYRPVLLLFDVVCMLKQAEAGKAEHDTKIAEVALAGQDTPKP